MNIRAMINREKSRFNEFKKKRIVAETEKLTAEKQRQGELAKLNAQKQKELRDLEALKSYNTKVQGPSKLQKFGKNLAATMNKAKEAQEKLKSKGGGPFGGDGKGINFGGTGKGPFN